MIPSHASPPLTVLRHHSQAFAGTATAKVVAPAVHAWIRIGSMKRHGFTLLELLVVVAIIGLLAAYVGPKYFSQIGRSEQAVAKSQIESFRGALGAYRIDTGAYPSSEEGLAALLARPGDSARAAKWNGPYLEKALPADPWGRPYLYRSPVTKDDYELISYGKDGQPGGTGDDADLSSR